MFGLALLGILGCDGAPDCVEVPASCTPQYEPTFDQVYANTLAPSCALSGCHGGDGGTTGLGFGADADAAYAAIGAVITPGDPGCSVLIDHLEPEGLGDMPPGASLDEEERCAVRTWIADGAAR